VGDPYRSAAVDDDVRSLYQTGQFYNIRVTDEVTSDGVILSYILQGNPQLTEIRFQGNTKFNDNKLRKTISSKTGAPLTESKLFADSQAIQALYQKKGYPGTQVKYVLNIDENAARGTATFEITESPKIKITDVVFVGAQAFTEKKLRGVIKTRRHWMFSWITGSGVFKDEQFEDDRETLIQVYRSRGYIDFEIKDVQFEHPTPTTLVIRFILYEGRQYKVGSVKFTGNQLFKTPEIAGGLQALEPGGVLNKKSKLGPNGLKMDVGDTFTPKGLSEDEDQVQNFYGSRGYIDVKPPVNLVILRIPNTDTGTIDLEFKIKEGEKSYIEKVEIRGNTKTKDIVIRRELAVAPGEVFDMYHVNISKDRLIGLNYFEKVDMTPEPTDVPNRKNLIVGVQEKNTGNLTLGAGFSSVDSLVGYAEMYQGNFDLFKPPNFTGAGQKLRLKVQLGTERRDAELQFIEPWFLQRKLRLDVDVYYHNLDFLSPNNLYHEIDGGTRIGLTRALGSDHLIGNVGYSFDNVGIIFNQAQGSPTGVGGPGSGGGQSIPGPITYAPTNLLVEQGYTLVSKITSSLAYETLGPGFLPDRGQRTELSADLAGPYGGVLDYYKLQLKTAWYFKGFAPGHVLELIGRSGVAQSYGSTDLVPFWDRYYLGGLDTLRGYRYRSVSPREPGSNSDEPIGGDTMWFASAEYSIPIIEHLRLATFFDIGNVELDPYNFSWAGYTDDWGIGIRLNLPVFGGTPLRLDYAFPLHHDQFNSSSGRFQIGVGATRGF
jgi:outer membrane protein insertion porin family